MHMQAKKFTRYILWSIIASLFAVSARAKDIAYDKLGDWSIMHVDTFSSNSCSAFTTFPDQTLLQLALIQTPSQVSWAIFLSNAKWNSIFAPKTQVTLSLQTSKSWSSTFRVTTSNVGDKPVLVSVVPTTFVRSIADADALFILDDKSEPLTGSFNMINSEHAIAAVEHCVREHPLTTAPDLGPSG